MDSHTNPALTPSANEPVRTHQDVLALIGDVERQLDRLRVAQTRSAEELAQQESRMREFAAREQALHAAEGLLIGREAQLQSMAEAIRQERVALNERATEYEGRLRLIDERGAALAEESQALAAERQRLGEEQASVSRWRETSAQRESEAALEREKGQAELAAMREELASVREQLADAESSLRARDAAFESKDNDLEASRTELRAALERLGREREALEQAIAGRDAELLEMREALAAADQRLAKASESAAAQAAKLERGAAAITQVGECERTIQGLREQIAAFDLERNEGSAKSSDIAAALEREREARRSADAEAQRLAPIAEQLSAANEQLESSLRTLREELAEAHRSARASKRADHADRESSDRVLEEKRRALGEVGLLLRVRKERIDRARRLRRERSRQEGQRVRQLTESAVVRAREEERVIKQQREELRQVQDMLASTERSLLRREGRQHGALAAMLCAVITAGLAAGSWFAAGIALPPAAVASVDLVAKTRDGSPLTPDADASFQSAYRDAIRDEPFRAAVEKRLQERRVVALGDRDAVAQWMDSIQVDSDGPGSLRLVAQAPDAETAIIALDTVATSLVQESPRLVKGRGDIARIALAGQTNLPGRVTFSALIPQTEPRAQLEAAALIFSVVAAVGLIVGLLVFGRLAKAKRSYEELEPA